MNRTLASGPIVWLGIIVTTCLLLLICQTVLWLVLPILFSVVFYYMLSPSVNYGISRGLTRAQAVFSVTVLLTVFLLAVGALLEPKVASTMRGIRDNKAQAYLLDATALFNGLQKTVYDFFPFLHPATPAAPPPQPGSLGVVTATSVTPAVATPRTPGDALKNEVVGWTNRYSTDIVLELLHWIPSVLLMPYLTYFFLLDGPRFKRFLVQAIPNAFFEKTLYLFYRVEDQLRSYFKGVLLLTLLDATCLGVGLWILGLDAPFFLAAIAAVIAWLPYLGSIAGCLMVMLVAHHDSPGSVWLPYEAIALFVLVRLCDDFIFLPMTVGRSLRMHPLITVLMILLGGAVAGISGLLLVMPLLGVVMVAGQIIGELLTDERVLARHRHARKLKRLRAQADLTIESG
jgi:predicted PurR-regulated permease PerM